MLPDGNSYSLGKVALGAAYQVLEALIVIYGIKYLCRGLWQINLLSYHIFMIQTLSWTWYLALVHHMDLDAREEQYQVFQ